MHHRGAASAVLAGILCGFAPASIPPADALAVRHLTPPAVNQALPSHTDSMAQTPRPAAGVTAGNTTADPTYAPITPADVVVTVDPATGVGVAALTTGVTHTQHSLDPWEAAPAVAAGRRALSTLGGMQDQAIMGWGTLNPEPSPGQFDFSSLDRRVQLIHATGGTPVLTLCCAPDWMKGGAAGTTDWSRLEVAPTPEHVRDFAELARQVALRYPDVRHYLVWNELKGFWNATLNRWDYEGYTALYNAVFAALKGVDSRIQVGGPYVPLLSSATTAGMTKPSSLRGGWGVLDQRGLDVLTYWRAHAIGADFVVVDGSTAALKGAYVPDEYGAASKMADLTTWVRTHIGLPVWWAEWYAAPASNTAGWSDQRSASTLVHGLLQLVRGGAAAAITWQPEGGSAGCGSCVWTTAATATGGQLSPWGLALRTISHALPPGTVMVAAHASNNDVDALATRQSIILVNCTPRTLLVAVGTIRVTLEPYGVDDVALR
jgi:hypothetical protein